MTIPAAFDSILDTATIDAGSLVWETSTTFVVAIDGKMGRRLIRGRVNFPSVSTLRTALANALRDYCAIGAAELVAA